MACRIANETMPTANSVPAPGPTFTVTTLTFNSVAAVIQPKCTAKGKRSSQNSLSVPSDSNPYCRYSIPASEIQISAMRKRDRGISSKAKAKVHPAWERHVAT